MTKFVLILYMCSMITQQCNNGLHINQEFNSHYNCAIAGYDMASKIMENMDTKIINDNRLAIKFECRSISILIPPKKPA